MDYKVYPLTYTAVNWDVFSQAAKEVLEVSPTKGLDTNKIDPDTPSAFLACLDFNNDPVNALIRNIHWGTTRNNQY